MTTPPSSGASELLRLAERKRAFRGPFACEKPEIASSLFEQIKRMGGEEWVAVRIRGDTLWEIKIARSQELLKIATATEGPELDAIRERLCDAVNEARSGDDDFGPYDAVDLVLGGNVSLASQKDHQP